MLGQGIGKDADGNPPAVERRQWEQIEDRQNDIDDKRILEIKRNPLRDHCGQIDQKMKTRGSNNCQADIHCRPGRRHKHHATAGIMKGTKIDRDWLGISKQEWRSCEQQESRQKNRSKWINMPEGIETDTAKSVCRIVTKEASNISVRRFMESNGDENREQPDRYEINQVHSGVCT